jgi:hypothetical protein
MGADGKLQEGLHHEDERLPSFVYGLKKAPTPPVVVQPNPRPCRNFKVGCDVYDDLVEINSDEKGLLPENPISAGITQKMETPVIYFYGREGSKVKVEIDFPKGLITQHYPKATNFSPTADKISGIGPSRFEFDVTLMNPEFIGKTPVTTPDSIWNPARQVKANTIESHGEHEKFIFYRGIGDFDIDLTVTSPKGEQLYLSNRGDIISDVFVLNSDGVKGQILRLGQVDNNAMTAVPVLNERALTFREYVVKSKQLIAESLVRSGLFHDEAIALVNTWEKSYFHTPGKRVLYILGRAETDALLPLRITPAPDRTVRTLIGRIEIMTHADEEKYLVQLAGNLVQSREVMFGRFYEPKLRRLLELAKERSDQSLENKIRTLLSI